MYPCVLLWWPRLPDLLAALGGTALHGRFRSQRWRVGAATVFDLMIRRPRGKLAAKKPPKNRRISISYWVVYHNFRPVSRVCLREGEKRISSRCRRRIFAVGAAGACTGVPAALWVCLPRRRATAQFRCHVVPKVREWSTSQRIHERLFSLASLMDVPPAMRRKRHRPRGGQP